MLTNQEKNCREIFTVIMTLFREIRCCSRDEALCLGVTFHQFVILDAVAARQELDLAELHGILSVEKSTTTRLVNPLLRKGLLKRETALHDSRAAKLSLTEAGRDTHRQVWECLMAFFESIDRKLPAGRREDVLDAVRIFSTAIREAAVQCRCCSNKPEGEPAKDTLSGFPRKRESRRSKKE
jgi:DNA-binding MarR family transcriptional regulator